MSHRDTYLILLIMLSTYLYIERLAGRSFGSTLSPEQTSAQTHPANSCQDQELFTAGGHCTTSLRDAGPRRAR